MPDILHRISIDASPEDIHALVATTDGIARWWTARPLDGETALGGRFGIYFGDADTPTAVTQMESDKLYEVVWRVLEGPDAWINTLITFALHPSNNGGTALLFTHANWPEASEFMSGCSTNWGAYLTGLKYGAEGADFRPYPQGEISRWS
jgi:uncharacterized protein YndB with AHSA1/START domain